MTDHNNVQNQDVHPHDAPGPNQTRKILAWATGGVVVLIVVVVAMRTGSGGGPEDASAGTPVDALMAAVAPDPAVLEQNSLAAVEEARRAFAESQLNGLKHTAEQAMAELDALHEEMAAWDREIVPLLTNDDGRYLAGNLELAKTFDTVFTRGRATRQDLEAMRSRVRPLLNHVEEALSDPSKMFVPQEGFAEKIQQERLAARSARDGYREDRELLTGMLREAKDKGQPSAQSLTVAITTLQKDYEREKALAIAAVRDRYEREFKDKLAEIEYRKGREISDEKARLRELEMEQKRVRLETEAHQLKANTEIERTKALASRPDIQKRFESFLTEGRVRIHLLTGQASPHVFDRPGPCSYSNLRYQGVLDDPKAFAKARAPHKKYYFNDRPTRAMPQTTEEWNQNDEDFKLFQELAPVFREMGLLRP